MTDTNFSNTDDVDATLAKLFAETEVQEASEPATRMARERQHSLRRDDGRRNKGAPARTEQFNLKLRQGFKQRMVDAARDESRARGRFVPIAELVEEVFTAYLDGKAKGKRKQ